MTFQVDFKPLRFEFHRNHQNTAMGHHTTLHPPSPPKKTQPTSRHCERKENRDVLAYSPPPNSCRHSEQGTQPCLLENLNSTLSQTEMWLKPSMCWKHKKLEGQTSAVPQICLHSCRNLRWERNLAHGTALQHTQDANK